MARSRAGLDFEEGQWLLAAWRGGVHSRLGFGSFREYIERLFGYGARLVQDKLRVAEALEQLPVLARALQDGRACWSVLRELTRVATPESEGDVLRALAELTLPPGTEASVEALIRQGLLRLTERQVCARA